MPHIEETTGPMRLAGSWEHLALIIETPKGTVLSEVDAAAMAARRLEAYQTEYSHHANRQFAHTIRRANNRIEVVFEA